MRAMSRKFNLSQRQQQQQSRQRIYEATNSGSLLPRDKQFAACGPALGDMLEYGLTRLPVTMPTWISLVVVSCA
jgi:hypothetical protein